MGKPEGKRPLGRPRHGWEDNIKIDLQKVGTCECGNKPSVSVKCGKFLDYLMTYQLPRKDSYPWCLLVGDLVSWLVSYLFNWLVV